MENKVQSLWPAEIRAAVQSPLAILADQAEALTTQTNGVLVGKVGVGSLEKGDTVLSFYIVVPELDDYRHRILTVQHTKDMQYPTVVDAELFRAIGLAGLQAAMKAITSHSLFIAGGQGGEATKPDNRADSDKELLDLVAKVLRSPYVVSVAQSLIARAEDVRAGRMSATVPTAESEGNGAANQDEGSEDDSQGT